MKIKLCCGKMMCLATISLAITARGGDLSLDKSGNVITSDGSVSGLLKLADEFETLWPTNEALFFQSEKKIGAVLEAEIKTNPAAMQGLKTLYEKVLRKHCPTNSAVAINCFKYKFKMAKQLTQFSSPNPKDAFTIAGFLGEIRETMITNYQRQTVDANVSPPIAPANGRLGIFSGMDPQAISDPVARDVYEKAINENDMREFENNLQLITLPELNQQMTPLFLSYIKKFSTDESKDLRKLAHLTEKER